MFNVLCVRHLELSLTAQAPAILPCLPRPQFISGVGLGSVSLVRHTLGEPDWLHKLSLYWACDLPACLSSSQLSLAP
jgi:hypothetical protein